MRSTNGFGELHEGDLVRRGGLILHLTSVATRRHIVTQRDRLDRRAHRLLQRSVSSTALVRYKNEFGTQ